MALQAKAIKQKMKGVGNIKKITRTMEMVSVSKMKKAVSAAVCVRDYNTKLSNILDNVSKNKVTEHVYFKNQGTKNLVVIISSNKGLAGSYNTNVYKKLLSYLKENKLQTQEFDALTVGKQSEKIAKRMNMNIVSSFIKVSDCPKIEEAEDIYSYIDRAWREGIYKKIIIVSTIFIKQSLYKPDIHNLLPLVGNRENTETVNKETILEPSQEVILDELVPRLLAMNVYSLLSFASASEHSSRMFAMKTASDNAGDLQKSLSISYNKARQDAVTQELAEIAAATSGS